MKNFKIFFPIMWSLIFLSCFASLKLKRAFAEAEFCYDNRVTNASQGRFNINGYYEFPYSNCIFYEDGIWVGGYDKNWKYKNNKFPDRYINGIWEWGTYKIVGDTIKVRYVQTAQFPNDVGEKWYLIVDTLSLNFLLFKYDLPITKQDLKLSRRQFPNGRKYSFIPYDSVPSLENSWFKNSKWLWCDKAAYEKWRTSQR